MPKYRLVERFGLVSHDDIKNVGIRSQKHFEKTRGRFGKTYSTCRKMYLSSQLEEIHELKKDRQLTPQKIFELRQKYDEQLERARVNYKFRNNTGGAYDQHNKPSEDEKNGDFVPHNEKNSEINYKPVQEVSEDAPNDVQLRIGY
jgi:hypothetical protein